MKRCKLIRDNLPRVDAIQERYARSDELNALLTCKLHEEATEIAAAGYQDVEEYADALQVLMDMAALNGIDWADVVRARSEKHHRKGGFRAGRVMVEDNRGET